MTETDWLEYYLKQILNDLDKAIHQPQRNEQLIYQLNEELAAYGLHWTPEGGLRAMEGVGE